MTQGAQGVDRHRTRCGRQTHHEEERRPAAQHAGCHIDVPHADAGRALRQLEDFLALPRRGIAGFGGFGHLLGLSDPRRSDAGDVAAAQLALACAGAQAPALPRELPPMARGYEGGSHPMRGPMSGWPTDLASAPMRSPTGPARVNDPPQWVAMLQSLPLGPVHGEAPEFSAPQPPGVSPSDRANSLNEEAQARSPHSQGRLTRRPCFFGDHVRAGQVVMACSFFVAAQLPCVIQGSCEAVFLCRDCLWPISHRPSTYPAPIMASPLVCHFSRRRIGID